MNNYYYADGQQQFGPYSLDELRAMNVVAPTTKVWCPDMAEWAEAQTVGDFSGWFVPTPPPLTPPTAPTAAPVGAVPARPFSWLAPAIVATVLCCTPFGIVSIVYAAKVDMRYAEGNYSGAVAASNAAKTWFWWSFGMAIFVYLCWMVAVVAGLMSNLAFGSF